MRRRHLRKHTAIKPVYWVVPAGLAALALLLFALGAFRPASSTPAPSSAASPAPLVTPMDTPAAAPAATPPAAITPPPDATPQPTPLGKPSGLPDTRYELAAELHPAADRLYGKLRVDYRNTTPDMLYELVFHLYPNAYATSSSIGMQELTGKQKFDAGKIIISAVSLNGVLANFDVPGDGLLLRVPLVKELLPGESAEVFIEFALDIPERDGRFGKTELGYQLGNFLPILAVYQDGAWMDNAYVPMGDPYYSEAANYAVAFTYPSDYALYCTGSILKSEQKSNGLTTTYAAASRVRDFACMFATGMQHAEETYEGVRIYSSALSAASAERGATLAKNALAVLTPALGEYPYQTLTVAQVNMYHAGMEYPNFLMVQRELYLPGRETELTMTLAHELIHQWFYGVVGSDQINAPWIDEALASYLGMVYFELAGDTPAYEAQLTRYIQGRAPQGGKIDGSLYEYATDEAYTNSVYWRGAALYHELRQEIGDDAFFEGLRLYIRDNAYSIATRADIVAAFESSSGRELGEWFDKKLAG